MQHLFERKHTHEMRAHLGLLNAHKKQLAYPARDNAKRTASMVRRETKMHLDTASDTYTRIRIEMHKQILVRLHLHVHVHMHK